MIIRDSVTGKDAIKVVEYVEKQLEKGGAE
jgi:hypothetical protein